MEEKNFNINNFEQEVLHSDKPVIIDFWAPWCGPCRAMGPVISRLANESDGSYVVGKVNVDEEEDLAVRYKIMSIPAIKVFKNGEVAASAIGISSFERLMEMVNAV